MLIFLRTLLILVATTAFCACALTAHLAFDELKDKSYFNFVVLSILTIVLAGLGILSIIMAFWLTQPAMI